MSTLAGTASPSRCIKERQSHTSNAISKMLSKLPESGSESVREGRAGWKLTNETKLTNMKKGQIKAAAARYLKIVEWSDEDKCFVGRVPGLFAGGVHGDNEAKVYSELCEVTEEWVALIERDGKPLPDATAGKTFSGKFVVRMDPEAHKVVALQAAARDLSLNQFVVQAIAPRGGESVSGMHGTIRRAKGKPAAKGAAKRFTTVAGR